MLFANTASRARRYLAARSWLQHDLPAGVAARELAVRVAHLAQGVDPRDRDLELALSDQRGELGQHVGARCRGRALGLDAVLRSGLEVRDRVDAVGLDAELERKLDVIGAERVDERI